MSKSSTASNSEHPPSSHELTEVPAPAVEPTVPSTTISSSSTATAITTTSSPMSSTTTSSSPPLVSPIATSHLLNSSNSTTPSTSTPSTPTIALAAAQSAPTLTNSSASGASFTSEDLSLFLQIYDCAKNNYSWYKVISAIESHPDWLTRIPQGRRWTMLHQIVYFGNVAHLYEILALQISNESFRFLCKTLDEKTVREVAAERAHIHPQMLRHVERIVASEQMLNNARDSKWELIKQFLRQQPDIANEKPPYRKLYLAHYLASTGQLDIFKDLSTICKFKLDLKVEDKTISEIARENNHIEFAEYIESLPVTNDTETDNESNEDAAIEHDSNAPHPTTAPVLSQGFYDDPGIMIFSLNAGTFSGMLLSQDPSSSYPNHHHHHYHHNHSGNDYEHSAYGGYESHAPAGVSIVSVDNQENSIDDGDSQCESNTHSHSTASKPMTEEEQQDYEKTVMENIKKFASENLLNSITCCITKAILKDPVVAADGHTYEREAILNWFQTSNRSPMTNEILANKDLKTNHAVKSILQSLYDVKTQDKKTEEKSKSNEDST